MKLDQLTAKTLNLAVEIYLEHAYRDTQPAADKAVSFDEQATPQELLAHFEDETEPRPDAHRFYSLRLGSEDYPHMKLSLWEAFHHGEFVLNVDAHDGFRFDESAPDYEEWLALKSKNRHCKLEIEEAWYEMGLSTMRRLKEQFLSRSDCIRTFSGDHVLLVDDDADAAAIVRMILEAAGIRCRWARTVQEAREVISNTENAFGMALVDVVMADGNGLEVVRHLRAEPHTQDTPVLLTSAMNSAELDQPDADGYLRKPFSAASLVRRVDEMLRRHHPGEAVFLDQSLDPS